MTLSGIIAFGGWILALIQLILAFLENRRKSDSELLEKTLGYFERGTQARSIALSLVEGIWFRRKKYLEVITPVLVSQLIFLLKEAEDFAQEERNLVRILFLLERCLPYAADPQTETIEVSEALLSAATEPGKISLGRATLRLWYTRFSGNAETFDAETAHLEPL